MSGMNTGKNTGKTAGKTAGGAAEKPKHQAGAFDIRNVIGGLMLVYGVILTVMGIIGNRDNLYTGLSLLVVSAFFVAWAILKPTVVPEGAGDDLREG